MSVRLFKRRLTTVLGTHLINPVVRFLVEKGIAPPSYAILETIGRRTGRARRTPVGNGLDGSTFWLVAEHGRRAAYVRNIVANPRVRVKVGAAGAPAPPIPYPTTTLGASATDRAPVQCRRRPSHGDRADDGTRGPRRLRRSGRWRDTWIEKTRIDRG